MRLHKIYIDNCELLFITEIPEWVDEVTMDNIFWPGLTFSTTKRDKPEMGLYWNLSHSSNKFIFDPANVKMLKEYKYEDLTMLDFLDHMPNLSDRIKDQLHLFSKPEHRIFVIGHLLERSGMPMLLCLNEKQDAKSQTSI